MFLNLINRRSTTFFSFWYFLIPFGGLLFIALIFFTYKRRMKSHFERQFNIISMRFFTLGQRMAKYPELKEKYMDLHKKMDAVHILKPTNGLAELESLKIEIDLLSLELKKKGTPN